MAKNWVKKAFSNSHGQLHKALHVPGDKPIPEELLEKATHSVNPTTRKRAQLAENARHFKH